jgi:hypothetical protein
LNAVEENLEVAVKLNAQWPLSDQARNGEWRHIDAIIGKWAIGAEAYFMLLGPFLVQPIVTCHELSPDQRLLAAIYGWCWAHVQQVCRAFSPVQVVDRRAAIKRGKPAADVALFSSETLLKFMAYLGNIVKPIASGLLERGSAFGTESQEHLHGAIRGLTRGDERINVIEGAIQQGLFRAFCAQS